MVRAEAVRTEAARLGFAPVGITTADPPEHFEFFSAWLDHGYHGEMEYLATDRSRTRRADPHRILPGCQSILLLGFPYEPAVFGEADGEPARGRIASYAWGRDYHDVVPDRLQALIAFIERESDGPVESRVYVDTGPVLERDLAQRAGLGWIGKNTCLIHPKLGSYFFLAAVLLDCRLEPDPPFVSDHCGTCTRCIDACPTACILPDRTLDASRCISYLTIELKGPIPEPLRGQMGDWVFGCDVCQQVCPWNIRFAPERGDPGLEGDPASGLPVLIEELSLDTAAFAQKFKNSPVTRAKRRGYLRNVAVALGNAGSATAAPALEAALLNDPETLVRGHAAWALGRIGGGLAAAALEKARLAERDPYVLGEIEAAVARLA